MTEPSAPTSFVRMRWAGVSHSQVEPPYAMLEEPHRLVLVVEGQPLLVRGCVCEECEAAQGARAARDRVRHRQAGRLGHDRRGLTGRGGGRHAAALEMLG